MSYHAKIHLRYLPVCLTGMIVSMLIAPILNAGGFCLDSIQERERPTSPAPQKKETSEAEERGKKTELQNPGLSLNAKSAERSNEEVAAARQRKREMAVSLLEGVLETAHQITPVEYGLLTQVEAAALLWESDSDRSVAIIKKAWGSLLELLEETKAKAKDDQPSRKQQRLRFALLRRIAKLNPDLLKQFGATNTNGESEPVTISGKWTDEARAIMSVAEEQVESNPALAAQLAQRSLPFGLVDWVPFLGRLSAQDSAQAEQVAAALMNRFNSISISPVELLHLDRFALDPARSPQVREQFFLTLAARFTQDLRPDISTEALRVGSQTAHMALGMATGSRWPVKFQEIIAQYDYLLSSRSAASSRPPRVVEVDTSMMAAAKPGETAEIEHKAQQTPKLNDLKARDKEYQKLAAAAANNENLSLAEELLSKIESDEVRRDAAIGVYGPLVRKSLGEADWTKAQTDALKISHPLGRTLILDIIAQMIMRSGKGKQDDANQIYDIAMSSLQRDGATEDVAKGFLIIARSLDTQERNRGSATIDKDRKTGPKEKDRGSDTTERDRGLPVIERDRGREAIDWAIFVLNKLTKNGELLTDSATGGALASWVSLPIRTLRYDEVLELTEMIGPLFKEMAKRDPGNAVSTANGLTHLGLSSLAQLGIVSELQKELRASIGAAADSNSKKRPPVRH